MTDGIMAKTSVLDVAPTSSNSSSYTSNASVSQCLKTKENDLIIIDDNTPTSKSENDKSVDEVQTRESLTETSGLSKESTKVIHPSRIHHQSCEENERDFTLEQHRDFVEAIFNIGLNTCSPSLVTEMMRDPQDVVTREKTKSHLQKYRKRKIEGKTGSGDFLKEFDEFLKRVPLHEDIQIDEMAKIVKASLAGDTPNELVGGGAAALCTVLTANNDRSDEIISNVYQDELEFLVLTEAEKKTQLGKSLECIKGILLHVKKCISKSRKIGQESQTQTHQQLQQFCSILAKHHDHQLYGHCDPAVSSHQAGHRTPSQYHNACTQQILPPLAAYPPSNYFYPSTPSVHQHPATPLFYPGYHQVQAYPCSPYATPTQPSNSHYAAVHYSQMSISSLQSHYSHIPYEWKSQEEVPRQQTCEPFNNHLEKGVLAKIRHRPKRKNLNHNSPEVSDYFSDIIDEPEKSPASVKANISPVCRKMFWDDGATKEEEAPTGTNKTRQYGSEAERHYSRGYPPHKKTKLLRR